MMELTTQALALCRSPAWPGSIRAVEVLAATVQPLAE